MPCANRDMRNHARRKPCHTLLKDIVHWLGAAFHGIFGRASLVAHAVGYNLLDSGQRASLRTLHDTFINLLLFKDDIMEIRRLK